MPIMRPITIVPSKIPTTVVRRGDMSSKKVEAFPVMSVTKPVGNVINVSIGSGGKGHLPPLPMPLTYFRGNRCINCRAP